MYTYIYIYIDVHIYIYVYIHNICIDVYREGPKGFSVIHLSPLLSGGERGTQES